MIMSRINGHLSRAREKKTTKESQYVLIIGKKCFVWFLDSRLSQGVYPMINDNKAISKQEEVV